jgi:hypothetical protein
MVLTIIINSKLNCILPTVMNGGVFRKYETRVYMNIKTLALNICALSFCLKRNTIAVSHTKGNELKNKTHEYNGI